MCKEEEGLSIKWIFNRTNKFQVSPSFAMSGGVSKAGTDTDYAEVGVNSIVQTFPDI